MTDYDFSTGTSGTVRIRVLTSTVEFWINAGQSVSWWGSVGYSWTSPNGNGSSSFGYPAGSGWLKIRTITVTSSGTVSINIGDTGTSAVGDPSNKSVYVSRASKPPTPDAPTFTSIGHTTIGVKATDNGDGGSAITARQIGWGTSSSSPTNYINAASGTATPLHQHTSYYFWYRVQNSEGWSNWSARSVAVTLAGAMVNNGGVWYKAVPYVKVIGVWREAIPYQKVVQTWFPCGT